MIARVHDLFSRERELKMIWELEKGGLRSYLVGTAHFFPYHFRGSLRRHIRPVDDVLFEGPLDQEAARRVVAYGSEPGGEISLVHALGPQTMAKITAELGSPGPGLSSHAFYRHVLGADPLEIDWDEIGRMRPWMAFFRIWSHYLRSNGWIYNMELDALRIAAELGKEVHFLETIEEQIEALNGVPLERMVNFLTNVDWGQSRRDHLRCYLGGDLEGLMAKAKEFPTICESIAGKRDPVLYARMKCFFEKGKAIAFVGTAHCQGIRARFLEDGYRVGPPAGL